MNPTPSRDEFEISGTRVRTAAQRRRTAMVSTHGYVAAVPPLGAADPGGQVVYGLDWSKRLAQLSFRVDIWTRQLDDPRDEEECGGLFADPFDAMDLVITISKPLRHAALAEHLSGRAAETARRRFAWTGVVQQLLAASERTSVASKAADPALVDLETFECSPEPDASNS